MTITLTGPVAVFFEAERAEDLEALVRCFDEQAHVFVVEGGTIVSLEIR